MNRTNIFGSRRDAQALSLLVVLFVVMLGASWQRWTQPLLDHGREMNLPLRILAGERLYADVQCLYGPFAPHFNALLYRVFGVHLAVLHTAGAVCAGLILLLIYWLARRLMNEWEAAAATGLVLVICALKSTANYVQPYAYAALYGLVFALAALVCTLRYVETRRARWLAWAGMWAGLSLLSKPELAAAALAAAAAAVLMNSVLARRMLWRDAACFVAPVIAITAPAYGLILSRVPWRVLLADNHILFSQMPPQLVYFNRHISGLAQWPASLWFSLAGLGVLAIWIGVSLTIDALSSMSDEQRREALKVGLLTLLGGWLWRGVAVEWLDVPSDVTPFASAVFVLPALIGVLAWRVWRERDAVTIAQRLLLVVTVFALVLVLRAILNVTMTGPYTPFFAPVAIVVYLYLLFRAAPTLAASRTRTPEALRTNASRAAVWLIALLIVGMAIHSARRFRRLNTFTISASRGSFITGAAIGEPLAAAIRYAEQHTALDDYVLTLPVATTINFLAARRYPLREEIVHPGFLTGAKELAAIELIKARRVPLILIANLDTSEFRDRTFGKDYNAELMRWIESNYRPAARFDSAGSGGAQFGDTPFFIVAYERNE